MAELDNRIDIQIAIQDSVATRQGFGILAIVHEHEVAGNKIRTFTGLTALNEVFPSYTPVGRFAELYFGQQFKSTQIKVIKKETSDSVSETLSAAILIDPDFYAVGLPGDVKANQESLASWVNSNKRVGFITVGDSVAPTSGTTDIGYTLSNQKNNRTAGWFTETAGFEMSIDTISVTDTTATANFSGGETVNVGDKVGIWTSDSSDLLGTYTVLTTTATTFTFTVPVGTNPATASSKAWISFNLIDAAISGKMMPQDAGSATWDFQPVAGINPDAFGSEQSFLVEKNYNWCSKIGGTTRTSGGTASSGGGGKMFGGRYIDIQRGADWLESNLRFDILDLMDREGGKLGYNAVGFSKIEAVISARLDIGITNNFLTTFASGETETGIDLTGLRYYVQMPNLADIPQNDKTNRLLQGIKIYANINGKIQSVAALVTLST